MTLTVKVLIGMGLGIALGLAFNLSGLNAEGSVINTYVVNALKMLVVPLVFFSLIYGVCGIGNIKTLGRVGSNGDMLPIIPRDPHR